MCVCVCVFWGEKTGDKHNQTPVVKRAKFLQRRLASCLSKIVLSAGRLSTCIIYLFEVEVFGMFCETNDKQA